MFIFLFIKENYIIRCINMFFMLKNLQTSFNLFVIENIFEKKIN